MSDFERRICITRDHDEINRHLRFDNLVDLVTFCELANYSNDSFEILVGHLENMFNATNYLYWAYSKKYNIDFDGYFFTLADYNRNILPADSIPQVEPIEYQLLDRLDSAFMTLLDTIERRWPDVMLVD